ncbi:MAG: hypothetical protein WBA93_21100 [Microcoleaceae cyanobacterium]
MNKELMAIAQITPVKQPRQNPRFNYKSKTKNLFITIWIYAIVEPQTFVNHE